LESGFKEWVINKWNSFFVRGNNISKLKDKLKMLKTDLKVWNREEFGCLDSSKKNLLKDIEAFDIRDNYSDLDEEAQLKRMEVISQLKVTDNKIASLCRQKTKAS